MAEVLRRDAVVRVSYGPEGAYECDFTLAEDGTLLGLYAPRTSRNVWEPRTSHGDEDTQRIIDALIIILSGFSYTQEAEEEA